MNWKAAVTIAWTLSYGCTAQVESDLGEANMGPDGSAVSARDGSAPNTRDSGLANPPQDTGGARLDAGPTIGSSDSVNDAALAPIADAGPDVSARVTPDLSKYQGLVLWLDATQGVGREGEGVKAWTDRSPQHNDARQENASFRPKVVSLEGGFSAVRFSGKTNPADTGGNGGPYLRVHDASSLNWGSGDWVIIAVASFDNPLDGTHNGTLGAFYGKWGKPEILFTGNWPISEHTEQASLHIGCGEGLPGVESERKSLNDGKVRVYVARRAGDALQLRVNGAASGQKGGMGQRSLDSPGIDVGIGSFSGTSATRSLRGSIASLIAIRGSLSDAQLSELEHQLMTYYQVAQ